VGDRKFELQVLISKQIVPYCANSHLQQCVSTLQILYYYIYFKHQAFEVQIRITFLTLVSQCLNVFQRKISMRLQGKTIPYTSYFWCDNRRSVGFEPTLTSIWVLFKTLNLVAGRPRSLHREERQGQINPPQAPAGGTEPHLGHSRPAAPSQDLLLPAVQCGGPHFEQRGHHGTEPHRIAVPLPQGAGTP